MREVNRIPTTFRMDTPMIVSTPRGHGRSQVRELMEDFHEYLNTPREVDLPQPAIQVIRPNPITPMMQYEAMEDERFGILQRHVREAVKAMVATRCYNR